MVIPRTWEWITGFTFAAFVLLAWARGLDRTRLTKITGIAAVAIGLTIFTSLILPRWAPPPTASAVHNLAPCLLLLFFYWLAGQFVTRADTQIEKRLEGLDVRWVAPRLEWCARHAVGRFVLTCLELAYMSYYAAIPVAVGALYLVGRQREAGFFWIVVLAANYSSCGMLAVIQTRPPRAIGEKWSTQLPCGKVRSFNLWILRQGSVQTNTFPSAHVAIATACALALLEIGPAWIGLIFLALAIGIALGAVAGRYHYLADAVLGFLFGLMAFLLGIVLAGGA